MGVFGSRILTKGRKRALDGFRKNAILVLEKLAKNAKDGTTRELYMHMQRNVLRTPIWFYPSASLTKKIEISHGMVFASVTKGENVNLIKLIQTPQGSVIVRSNFINLPAEHIFSGDKMSIPGIFTISHEYAHFPKPKINEFAKRLGISGESAEELLADILASKLAVALGYPKEGVLALLSGRQLVYGAFPFEKFILKAIGL